MDPKEQLRAEQRILQSVNAFCDHRIFNGNQLNFVSKVIKEDTMVMIYEHSGYLHIYSLAAGSNILKSKSISIHNLK